MTYTARFRACLAEVLRWEGGWSNDPFDTGGPTNKGITLGVYAGYIGALGVAISTDSRGRITVIDRWAYERLIEELRTIPDATVAAIYHKNYWQAVRGDELPVGVDLAVFDFAVNSGPPRAIRHLQRVLGVTQDGHMGPMTLAAARAADPATLIPKLMDSRVQFLRQIDVFWRFGKGWLRRTSGVQQASVASLGLPFPAPPGRGHTTAVAAWATTATPEPLPDPDAQSATQGRARVAESVSMAQSSTGRAAEAAGGLSGVQVGVEVSSAAARARDAGGGFDVLAFALTLAQSPTFWLAAGALAAAAYVWLERRRKILIG
jgi:lysozyme family protein